jgi:DNA-binding response OmpR family regulator
MDEAAARQGIGTSRRVTRTILAVDPVPVRLHALAEQLDPLGYPTELAEGSAQALELLSTRSFDLVLIARTLPAQPALHMLQQIRVSRDIGDMPVILLVEAEDKEVPALLRSGADECLIRPFDFEALAARIDRALARASRLDDLKRCNMALDARIATRAIELGEMRSELATVRADRARLIESIEALHAELHALRA